MSTSCNPSSSAIESPVPIWDLLDADNDGLRGQLLQDNRKPRFHDSCSQPINGLPVEILGEIFGICLLDMFPIHMRTCNRSISPSPNADPQLLSQVCRYWRDIALAMPALWSTICIADPKQQHVQKVALWLERSQAYGLSLKFMQRWCPDHAVTDRILSLFTTQVHRWRDVEFIFSSVAHQPVLNISEGAALALESATISSNLWDYTSVNRLWQVLRSSPALRRINWTWSCSQAPEPLLLQVSRLTHVTLCWVFSIDILIDILRSCEQVEELHLHSLWPDYSTGGSNPPLVLPNLRVLSITDIPDPGLLFCRLTLPSLTFLEFNSPIYVEHPTSFLGILERSCGSLERINISSPFPDNLRNLAPLLLEPLTDLELS